MTKLNPCPNCGNEPELVENCEYSHAAICQCGLAIDINATTVSAAINGWNDVTANFTQPVKTLRDEFAMAAMGGVLQIEGLTYQEMAIGVYQLADAMLKERSK